MDGFKNSSKTHYLHGGPVKGAAKISKVMGEFKAGTLHSGSKSGPEVTNPKQATAIALSEARKAGAKMPVKKNMGGIMEGTSARPRDARGRELTMRDMAQADRDVGGMTAAEVRAAGDAIGRGNRTPYEPMPRDLSEGVQRTPRPRSVTVERTTVSESPAPRTALDRKLSTLPSQKGEMGKPKARGVGSFRDIPLVRGALEAVGLKKGGLAAMPRGKKC